MSKAPRAQQVYQYKEPKPVYTRRQRIAINSMWVVGPLAVAGVFYTALACSGQLPF